MLAYNMYAPCMQSRVFTPWPQIPRRNGQTKAKHTQSRPGSPGPIWYCRGPPNHDNDTKEVARGQCWPISCKHRMCKAGFHSLASNAASVRPNQGKTHGNSHLALQGQFGTTRCRHTMTTTPESSLEINAGPNHARISCAKPSLTPWPQMPPRCGQTKAKHTAIHTWLSRAHLVLLGSTKS